MPDDFTQAFLQSYAISSQRAERMAELRARQGLQALQERQLAQNIQMAAQKHAQEGKFRRDLAGAWELVQHDMQPIQFEVPQGLDTTGLGPTPGMTSEPQIQTLPGSTLSEAMRRRMLPVIAENATSPLDVFRANEDISQMELREAQAVRARAFGSVSLLEQARIASREGIADRQISSREEIAANALTSRERLSEEHTRLTEAQKAINNAFAERRITNEDHRLQSQEVSQQLRNVSLQMQAADKGYKIEGAPSVAGGASAPTLTPVARPPTTATITQAQEGLVRAEKTLGELNDFDSSVQRGHVGFRGVVGENLFDKLLPQFGFDTADIQRMKSRGTLATTIEGSLRQLSNDTRFSNEDRRDIKRIMPGMGVVESLEHTKQTTQLLRRVLSKRALIDANSINRPAPLFALDNYGVSLAGAVQSGLMTLDDLRSDLRNSIEHGLIDETEGNSIYQKFIKPIVR